MYRNLKFVEKINYLNQIALASMRLSTERSIMKRFITAGMNVMGADYGFAFLKEKGKRGFKLAYMHENTPYRPVTPRSTGITARAFRSRIIQYIENTEDAQHIRDDTKGNMTSVVVIPIYYKKAKLGTLDYCFVNNHTFTEEEKVLCEILSRNAATALLINRLFKEQTESLKSREQFLALVSHELKTPITSMKLYAQHLWQSALKNHADAREIEGLELINRQIIRLTKMVNDMLVFGRSKSGPIQLHLEEVDLVSLMNNTVKQLQIIAEGREMVVETKVSHLSIIGDKNKLEQVLVNLISNAIKYSPDETQIHIEVSSTDDCARIAVSDQGLGIPHSKRKHIFKEYVQAANTHSRGFGLGLYISKQIIDRHHGHIWVESPAVHQDAQQNPELPGSTFFVDLPLPVIEIPT